MIASFHKCDPMRVLRAVGFDGLDMVAAPAWRFLRIARDVG
jgi:hypothetical protein